MDGIYINYVFEGAGSALSDGSDFFGSIGAVVYSYNQHEINLWYPGAGDYLIYIGGTWGRGAPTHQSTTASVSVKVIKADSTLPGIHVKVSDVCVKTSAKQVSRYDRFHIRTCD